MEFPTGPGVLGGPISPDAWKRAVYRSPPRVFNVEVLTPEKQGGSYSYGFRICPIKGDNVSLSSSAGSTSSKGSHIEYEIWRRWEDCLWFQETLECEYARTSREKRTRLAAGKGVKKDGVYIQSDQAASFESLPPGPDPNSIALDIHDCIPKLTKKGTLFRASQATIEQRHRELQAMVNVIFQDDVPMLIKELRTTRTFTDFFGFWRRDHDLALKRQKGTREKPRNSVSSSVFSSYFAASSPALSDVPPVPRIPTSPLADNRVSVNSDSSSSEMSSSKGSRSNSSTSLLTPSHQSIRQPVIVPQDVPLMFGHNPQFSDLHNNDRPTSMLESLPEDRELLSPGAKASGQEEDANRPPLRRRKSSAASEINRNCRIFITSPNNLNEADELLAIDTANRPVRHSWQTTSSASSIRPSVYFADLDVDLALPSPSAPEFKHRPRASMASMASFMTDNSADAVLPRSQFSDLRRSLSSGSRRPHPDSLTKEEQWDEDEPWNEDVLDAYFYGMAFDQARASRPETIAISTDFIRPHSPTRSETPIGEPSSSTATSSSEHFSNPDNGYAFSPKRSSIATSISSDSATSYQDGTISIKAMHNNSIIVLRTPRTLSFDEVRQKIYAKFVGQEGAPLSESFAVAHLVTPDKSMAVAGRTRSNSLSAIGNADQAQLDFISSQEEWDQVVTSNVKNKILLRVIGTKGS